MTKGRAAEPRIRPMILHCHSAFSSGSSVMRSVQLMNAFGPALDHTIISDDREAIGARAHIAPGVSAVFPDHFPQLAGFPSPGRLVGIAQAMKPFDLVLTHNWGAIDVVMAHTVFARTFGLAPLIHHEDGCDDDGEDSRDTARGNARQRNWYRRIALGGATFLVVPTMELERIALETWFQPSQRIARIAHGIDTAAFARKPQPDALRVLKRSGESWVGTLASLLAVNRLPQLVRAIADLPEHWHLVILGEGPERDAIRAAAAEREISHRVHLPGPISDPASVIGLFDIFALSSLSEQFPRSMVEAMAAGLPVAAPDIGDIRQIVAEPNAKYLARANDVGHFTAMLAAMAEDPALRAQLGEANRQRACAHYDQSLMIKHYHRLYSTALGREF